MLDIETQDALYSLYLTLSNSLLIIEERTRRMETITDHEDLIIECECLYEAYGHIKNVAKELLVASKIDHNYANNMPTEAIK